MMKATKILAMTALTVQLVVSSALANLGGLQPVMKEMGQHMKVMVSALVKNDPVTDETLMASAQRLVELSQEAIAKAPSQMVDENGQLKSGMEPQFAEYQKVIGELTVALTELQEVIATGDRAAAAQVLRQKVSPVQKKGHELFKE